MVVGSPARVTVGCGRGRLLVGFSATRQTMGMPELMPPSMPPWRLEAVAIWPLASWTKGSLLALPRAVATAKPAPYSKATTAGNDSRPLAKSALSLSKTGSPQPGGTPVATSSQTPPIES
jgi:hypothetical protein